MNALQKALQIRMDRQLQAAHRRGLDRDTTARQLGVSVRTVIRWAKRLGLTRGSKQ
jgi:undecaprenyl pyrophosphate synthase